jgi:hypothetical protein
MAKKPLGIALDTKGFDKMVEAIDKEHRKPALKKAMFAGVGIVRAKIREKYYAAKPQSNLGEAIVPFMYPSGEGGGVRRFYVKGGMGNQFGAQSPAYRAYILNFLEKGAADRKTTGQGRIRWGPQFADLNRGSIPALKFFKKGWGASRNKAVKEMERVLLREIADLARGKGH